LFTSYYTFLLISDFFDFHLTVASKSQVLASHRIVAVVAADHKIDVDALVCRRIGSLLNFAAGHTLTWTQKQGRETVEVCLKSIKKIEDFCASSEPLIRENNVSEVAIQDPSAINNVLLGESNNVQAPPKSPCHVPATAEKLPKDVSFVATFDRQMKIDVSKGRYVSCDRRLLAQMRRI
jgi:hypothetical protein